MAQFLFSHAFGQTYALPLPLWMFLFAASAVVVVSFAVVALVFNQKETGQPESAGKKTKDLSAITPTCRLLGVFLLLLTIISSLFGTISYLNFGVVAFWIIFLLGFTYLVAIFGNLWELINPYKGIVELIERLAGRPINPIMEYPKWLAYYPAFLISLGLIWLELLSGGLGTEANALGRVILAYSAITIFYAFIFGKEAWFKYGEMFSVFFNLVSKLSPIKITDKKLSLRKPFSGLLEREAKDFSLLLFILLMLSATGFDAFRETRVYSSISSWLSGSFSANQVHETIFLIASPFILLGIYLFFVWIMKLLAVYKPSLRKLAVTFAFSLLPIAVAYNAAHYFPLLAVQGPTIIQYASDPLDLGWDLFGTASNEYAAGPISASTVWYTQIALIIGGHVVAVYIAHRIALRTFSDFKKALYSQYAMLVLMIIYTTGSLWIIGQPLSVG